MLTFVLLVELQLNLIHFESEDKEIKCWLQSVLLEAIIFIILAPEILLIRYKFSPH